MNEDFGVDLDQVFEVIGAADVLIVRFHLVQKRLLVDFRVKPGVGPFMALVARAESVEDRFRSIKKLRPEFPFPEKVMSFQWPRSMPVLLASGAWEHIADRLGALGGFDATELCGRIMEEMLREEHMEVVGAITGVEHYRTLWERPR